MIRTDGYRTGDLVPAGEEEEESAGRGTRTTTVSRESVRRAMRYWSGVECSARHHTPRGWPVGMLLDYKVGDQLQWWLCKTTHSSLSWPTS